MFCSATLGPLGIILPKHSARFVWSTRCRQAASLETGITNARLSHGMQVESRCDYDRRNGAILAGVIAVAKGVAP